MHISLVTLATELGKVWWGVRRFHRITSYPVLVGLLDKPRIGEGHESVKPATAYFWRKVFCLVEQASYAYQSRSNRWGAFRHIPHRGVAVG